MQGCFGIVLKGMQQLLGRFVIKTSGPGMIKSKTVFSAGGANIPAVLGVNAARAMPAKWCWIKFQKSHAVCA